jgi:hypothetical protein
LKSSGFFAAAFARRLFSRNVAEGEYFMAVENWRPWGVLKWRSHHIFVILGSNKLNQSFLKDHLWFLIFKLRSLWDTFALIMLLWKSLLIRPIFLKAANVLELNFHWFKRILKVTSAAMKEFLKSC